MAKKPTPKKRNTIKIPQLRRRRGIHSPVVRQALEDIRLNDPDGLLKPRAVVAAARRKSHPLHSHFTWTITKAAMKCWLHEAQQLISAVLIDYSTPTQKLEIPAFVSLTADRMRPGGGYRSMTQVITSPELLEQLRQTALNELQSWIDRHTLIEELVRSVAKAAKLKPPPRSGRRRRTG